jgi:hypothetical protein
MRSIFLLLRSRAKEVRPLYRWYGRIRSKLHDYKAILQWRRAGYPRPPPNVIKRGYLRRMAREHRLRVFVETGTYQGDTLAVLRRHFERLHSIELSDELYRNAAARFAGDPGIKLWHGDSSIVLGKVLGEIQHPALFWLDGHYSGGHTALGQEITPIRRELEQIAGHACVGRHVVVIDDARLFRGTDEYPTIEEVKSIAEKLGFKSFQEEHDFLVLK